MTHAQLVTDASPSVQALGALRDNFQKQRAEVIATYRTNRRCDPLLQGLRRVADRAILQLLGLYPLPPGSALCAVGGYGRGELYPHSDIDILILLPHPADAEAELLISRFLAALWDIGLEPGHSVRTLEQCLNEAAADVTVETALLEARWLAGSRNLLRQLTQQLHAQLDPQAFFQTKRLEMQQRHTRHDNTPYALEPNCKEAPGGLRDLQVILWMARAAGYGRTWGQIADAGLLTPDEARQLRRAEQTLKRLRIELHLLARRREDRVLFDYQTTLAEVYEITGSGGRRPSEVLMQRYYRAAHSVTQLNAILVQNIEARLFPNPNDVVTDIDADFVKRRGLLDMRREDAFDRKPILLLRAFLVMQQHSDLKGMSVRMLRAIWHARGRIDAQFRSNPVARKLFLRILQQPRGIVHELRRMNDLGILAQYLPPFRRVVGQMQHDLFHVYTVDQHTLMVIRNLRRFTMPEHAHEYPLCSDLIANFDRHWLLYIAALFHDIAKGRGGDHSELGAQEVRRFARHHGLAPEDAELVEFLVCDHLLLSSVAQKQDLSNPQVILDFASRVRTPRRLVALYLLTVADIRGTSPRVWNSWKGRLLEDLYRKTLDVLGGASPNPTALLDHRQREAALILQAAGLQDEAREALWRELDIAYFLRNEATDIAWHTQYLYEKVNSPEPVVGARAMDSDTVQFVVYAPQTAHLFTRQCAWFESERLSIQDARIHTTRHGWVLNTFIVIIPSDARGSRLRLDALEGGLARYLEQTNGILPKPHTTSGRTSRRSRAFPVEPTVELHPDERGTAWILKVTATDRPGFLHSVARVFERHDIRLHMAKVTTLGERVEDMFVISGAALGERAQIRFEEDLLRTLRNE